MSWHRLGAGSGLTGAEVVGSRQESVGEVTGHLWTDASGFEVLAVSVDDDEVAVPIRLQQVSRRGGLTVSFSADDVREAPRIDDLAAAGGAEAVGLVEKYYGIALSGPPPGPGTTGLPPWWDKESGSGLSDGPGHDEPEA